MSTQQKHTPGPWTCHSGMVWFQIDKSEDGIPLAYMDREPGNGTLPVERDANAKLMAAAPGMLAALEAAWPWLENERRKHTAAGEEAEAAYMGELADKVRAAIPDALRNGEASC